MKKITLHILIMVYTLNFFSQELIFDGVQHIGTNPDITGISSKDEAVLDLQIDNSGSTYTLFNVGSDPNPYIEKHDAKGQMVWRKHIDGLKKLTLNLDQKKVFLIGTFSGKIDVNPDSGTVNITSKGGVDSYLIELNARDGSYEDVKHYSGLEDIHARDIIMDDNGNIFISGTFTKTANFDPDNDADDDSGIINAINVDIFILKLNEFGNFNKIFQLKNNTNNPRINLHSIKTDRSDNIYIGAEFIGSIDVNPDPDVATTLIASNINYFLLKLDSESRFVHVKQIKGSFILNGFNLAVDDNENIYGVVNFVGGQIELDPNYKFSTGSISSILFKQDANGNIVWAYQYKTGQIGLLDIVINSQKNRVYTTGYFIGKADFNLASGDNEVYELITASNSNDGFIHTLDLDGNFIEVQHFGGNDFDLCDEMVLDTLGNIIVAGIFSETVDFNPSIANNGKLTARGDQDVFVLKLKKNNPLSMETIEDFGDTIKVYPNPTMNGYTQINFANAVSAVNIKILSLEGRVIDVKNYDHTDNVMLDIPQEYAGVYIIQITSPEGFKTVRLIKK
jgi:Secretion system C-terminal sorting domain